MKDAESKTQDRGPGAKKVELERRLDSNAKLEQLAKEPQPKEPQRPPPPRPKASQ